MVMTHIKPEVSPAVTVGALATAPMNRQVSSVVRATATTTRRTKIIINVKMSALQRAPKDIWSQSKRTVQGAAKLATMTTMQATKEATLVAIPEAMTITTKRVVLVEATQIAWLEAKVGAMQMISMARMAASLEVGAVKMILTTMGVATQAAELAVLSTMRYGTMLMRTNLLAEKVGVMMRGSKPGVAFLGGMRTMQGISMRVALLAVEA
jgi:hypothetical protein